ncbi:MAG TPA: hypothetical protein VFD06_07785, partial [Candidatus Polarisedimenticolia bacterium]|nr:hypothetical protein [Candidatus Polarisedimenticolia bacterium]
TTTVVSPILDLTGRTSVVLEMALFYSNSGGNNPGEDPYRVHVSGNGGASWTPVLQTTGDIASWTTTPLVLDGLIPFNNQFRVRVTAEDLGVGGSLVEAGFDDVSLYQPGAGCSVCSGPVATVGTIQVNRSDDDIVLDWSADPVNASAYEVYMRSGSGLATLVRAGSTTTKSFVHTGAGLLTDQNLFYVVTAVDSCGRESAPF